VASVRRLAAIMFTDMVGFTASAQADEATALTRLREEQRIVRPLFAPYGGREVKSTGDGFLVEFASAMKATECAVEIQRRLREPATRRHPSSIQVRIGVHVGDVEEDHGDIFGDAVNVAARVVPLAEPGGICLSEHAFALVRNKVPYRFEKLAPRGLKGVRDPVDVYRVLLPWDGRGASSGGASPPRVAVLPLANISPDPKDEYFADGLTEELISVLSQIHGLRVIARTSVGQYKGTAKPITQIGSELGVGSVLEGSVRKDGDQLRITVQLIDVPTEEHRWALTYDRKLENVFAIQAEVAKRTAEALKLELLKSERQAVEERPTSSLAAYEYYLRGIQASRRVSVGVGKYDEIDREAESHFEQAIREDPHFSAAYSHLANHLLAVGGVTRIGKVAYSRARELVSRALELNPQSAEAYTARGNLAMQADSDWPNAEAEFLRALESNPSSSNAHFWYANLLAALQRYSEAKDHLVAAIELDPLWFLAREALVSVHLLSGDWDAAVSLAEHLTESFRVDPNVERDARRLLAWVYAYVGRPDDAAREDERIAHPSDPGSELVHALFLAWLGKTRQLSTRLRAWEHGSKIGYLSPLRRVEADVLLGRNAAALSRLEHDLRNGESYFWAHYQAPPFDPIRDDPRFVTILEKLHLPTSRTWRRSALGSKPKRTT
jgi:adenylate cyclase